MDETAKLEQMHRAKVAEAAELPVEDVTPVTHETPLDLVAEKAAEMKENAVEGGGNMAEEGGSAAFGGSTTEVGPSNRVLDIFKKKMEGRLKPGQEIEEKE